jgi:hypothetical protein
LLLILIQLLALAQMWSHFLFCPHKLNNGTWMAMLVPKRIVFRLLLRAENVVVSIQSIKTVSQFIALQTSYLHSRQSTLLSTQLVVIAHLPTVMVYVSHRESLVFFRIIIQIVVAANASSLVRWSPVPVVQTASVVLSRLEIDRRLIAAVKPAYRKKSDFGIDNVSIVL